MRKKKKHKKVIPYFYILEVCPKADQDVFVFRNNRKYKAKYVLDSKGFYGFTIRNKFTMGIKYWKPIEVNI